MQAPKHLQLILSITIAASLAAVSCTGKISQAKPTVAEAEKFMADTENLLADLSVKASRAAWVQANFITDDTEAIASQANQDYIEATTKLAKDVKRFDGMTSPACPGAQIQAAEIVALFPERSKGTRRSRPRSAPTWKPSMAKGKHAPMMASIRANASPSEKWNRCLRRAAIPKN